MESVDLDSILSKLGVAGVKKGNRVILEATGRTKEIDSFVLGLTTDALLDVPEIADLYKSGESIQTIKKDLITALTERVKEQRKNTAAESDWFDASQVFPIHCIESDDVVIFHKTGGRSTISPKAFAKRLGVDYSTMYYQATMAYIKYIPSNLEGTFFQYDDQLGKEVYVANTYVAPAWKNLKEAKAVIPPLYEKFFNHLFPLEEERLAVYHWLYFSLTDRSQTILCVPGIQGIGKTIFGEKILAAMFGRKNWAKAPRSFVSKEFNSFLESKRIVLVEEIPTPKSREDRIYVNEMLKDITNDVVTIEGKGTNSKEVDNFANLIVTSNKLRAIPLETPIDRRFLCVSTPKQKLDTVFTNEEYTEFLSSINHASIEIAQFCNWILAHGRIGKESAHYNIQNSIKYQIYRMSLTRWELTILKSLDKEREMKRGVFTEADLEGYVKKDKVKISTIEEFLDTFQMPSGNALGHWDSKGAYVLSAEAMNNPIYVSPKRIQSEIYEDALDAEKDDDDSYFLTKYGMSKEAYEALQAPKNDSGLEAL